MSIKMHTLLLFVLVLPSILTEAQECGKKPPQIPWDQSVDQYITAGRDASPGAWPWQLSIQYRRDDGTWYHTCGAVLIEPTWAVTAAHCTDGRADPSRFRIIAAGHNVKELSGKEQIIKVDLIVNHKWYVPFPPAGIPNDIGLLRLAEKADLTRDDIDVACVPDESVGNFANDTADCWISGWGVTFYNHEDIPDVLQEANVPIPTNLQCRLWYNMSLRQSHICAGTGTPAAW